MKMVTISYAVTVCNELQELKDLIYRIRSMFNPKLDEIVVLVDFPKSSEEIREYLEEIKRLPSVNVFKGELEGDFAKFKNDLNSKCKKDYIFQIDADELPSVLLLGEHLRGLLHNNPEVDLFIVPRINIVEADGQNEYDKYVKSQGWISKKWDNQISELGAFEEKEFINFPDNQSRIYKNDPEIKWRGKVHESLQGHKNYTVLVSEVGLENIAPYCLIHIKQLERQKKQNEFYQELIESK